MTRQEISHLSLKPNKRVPFYQRVERLSSRHNLRYSRDSRLASRHITMARQQEEPKEHQAHAAHTEKEGVHKLVSSTIELNRSPRTSFDHFPHKSRLSSS